MSQDLRVAQALAQGLALGLPRLDVHMLLLLALQRNPHDRAWLLAHDQDMLPPEAVSRYNALLQRRHSGEPLAYLRGTKEFFGLNLQIDARVLDPRDDTETLVEWALACLATLNLPTPRVLDLGTGSGAIALALRAQYPQAQVWASDASADALAVAQENAQWLGLPLHTVQSHWFEALAGQCFDLLVSNPPYIADNDPHLPALRHEPRRALVSGADGLDDLRILTREAPAHLNAGGWLLLEHGHDQAPAVRAMLAAAGFQSVQSRCDLAGIERCSGGLWPGMK